MTQPIDEKTALEQAAVEQFAEVFTASAGRGVLQLVTLLSPPNPDARCTLGGNDIFVEVAHIYGTQPDARLILGRTGYAAPSREEQLQSSLVPLNYRVISALNTVLAQKAQKTYASSPVWLVVRNGFPLWCDADFERNRHEISVPKSHPFAEIWLVCGPRSDFGLIRLDNAA
jgi:hypothetical protein